MELFDDLDVPLQREAIDAEATHLVGKALNLNTYTLADFEIVTDSGPLIEYPQALAHRLIKLKAPNVPFITIDIIFGSNVRMCDSTASQFEIESVVRLGGRWRVQLTSWAEQVCSYHRPHWTVFLDKLISLRVRSITQHLCERRDGTSLHDPFSDMPESAHYYGGDDGKQLTLLMKHRTFQLFTPLPIGQVVRLKQRIARWYQIGLRPDLDDWPTVTTVMYINRCPIPTALETSDRDSSIAKEFIKDAKRPVLCASQTP
jgi:hypothetical protein